MKSKIQPFIPEQYITMTPTGEPGTPAVALGNLLLRINELEESYKGNDRITQQVSLYLFCTILHFTILHTDTYNVLMWQVCKVLLMGCGLFLNLSSSLLLIGCIVTTEVLTKVLLGMQNTRAMYSSLAWCCALCVNYNAGVRVHRGQGSQGSGFTSLAYPVQKILNISKELGEVHEQLSRLENSSEEAYSQLQHRAESQYCTTYHPGPRPNGNGQVTSPPTSVQLDHPRAPGPEAVSPQGQGGAVPWGHHDSLQSWRGGRSRWANPSPKRRPGTGPARRHMQAAAQ